MADKNSGSISKKDRKILEKFVHEIIRADVTSMVHYILEMDTVDAPFSIDNASECGDLICPECGSADVSEYNMSNLKINYDDGYVCPVCKSVFEERQMARSCCLEFNTYLQCDKCSTIFNCAADLLDTGIDDKNMQWLLVPEWVGNQLYELGECIIQTDEYTIWGRHTEDSEELWGDDFIYTLAYDAKILNGMENSWSDYV